MTLIKQRETAHICTPENPKEWVGMNHLNKLKLSCSKLSTNYANTTCKTRFGVLLVLGICFKQ